MLAFIGRRILVAIPTIVLISIFVFSLQQLLPGDPILAMAGEERDPETIAFLREKYGFNDPLPVQYVKWVTGVVQGDLGISLRSNQPVSELLLQKLPVTIQLAIMAMIFAIAIGVPMGIVSAVKKGTVLDYAANLIALSGLSIPNFWLGIMLILLVSVKWGLLPASGYVPPGEDLWLSIKTMLMPAFVLGTALAATLMRHTRSAMLGVLKSDYVRTARAKGLGERIIITRHVLRNAMIPIVTIFGNQVAFVLGGTVIVEQIFRVPGVGFLALDSINKRDYPLVMGTTLVLGFVVVTTNLLVDLSYGFIDPRIRYN